MSSKQQTTATDTKEKVLAEFKEPLVLKRMTDARSMREEFGMAPWDREAFDFPSVIPNCLEHSWDSPTDEVDGGTDWLARGKPGTGKSTLANYLTVRLLESNREKVVWRGSSSRSEWLPLAPWTTLYLPEGVDISVRLEPKVPTRDAVNIDVDELTEIVREVRRYADPRELNQTLDEGSLHVVYPDPRMRGCQEVYDASPEKQYDTPPKRETLFSEEDPASHWWFAWVLARVEHGPHHWTSLIFDEIGDVCPQSASKDTFGTYQKVELLKDTWVDARKFGLSVYAFAHSETDVHQMIRRKLRWRVQMPGTANPTKASDVVGFESIRMNHDVTSRYDVGEALMYTESNFESFGWDDMPSPSSYKLKIAPEVR
ncbi:ATP-binding protein [Halorubrum sp. F4]|uniref:ATP-binding protein n=1 Tax=Halorubrum sp. F4 TaxID=2989715 RepID=UPI00247FC549|nr:ATP-binding protein [Halorubrum sp. F4]